MICLRQIFMYNKEIMEWALFNYLISLIVYNFNNNKIKSYI